MDLAMETREESGGYVKGSQKLMHGRAPTHPRHTLRLLRNRNLARLAVRRRLASHRCDIFYNTGIATLHATYLHFQTLRVEHQ